MSSSVIPEAFVLAPIAPRGADGPSANWQQKKKKKYCPLLLKLTCVSRVKRSEFLLSWIKSQNFIRYIIQVMTVSVFRTADHSHTMSNQILFAHLVRHKIVEKASWLELKRGWNSKHTQITKVPFFKEKCEFLNAYVAELQYHRRSKSCARNSIRTDFNDTSECTTNR